MEFVIVEESVLLHAQLVVEPLDDDAVGDSQFVDHFGVAKFATCLHKVIFLNLSRFLEIQVLEESLHLLKEAAVHEDGADATQELVKVDILFLALVKQRQDTPEDLWWVLKTEHLGNLDEVKAFDARRAMILLQKCVRMEHVVLKRLHVNSVQRDQSIGAENVHV